MPRWIIEGKDTMKQEWIEDYRKYAKARNWKYRYSWRITPIDTHVHCTICHQLLLADQPVYVIHWAGGFQKIYHEKCWENYMNRPPRQNKIDECCEKSKYYLSNAIQCGWNISLMARDLMSTHHISEPTARAIIRKYVKEYNDNNENKIASTLDKSNGRGRPPVKYTKTNSS